MTMSTYNNHPSALVPAVSWWKNLSLAVTINQHNGTNSAQIETWRIDAVPSGDA
jgi:hypothetical protein